MNAQRSKLWAIYKIIGNFEGSEENCPSTGTNWDNGCGRGETNSNCPYFQGLNPKSQIQHPKLYCPTLGQKWNKNPAAFIKPPVSIKTVPPEKL